MLRIVCSLTFVAGVLGLLGTAQARLQDSKLKFELYKDKADEFRWRLKAANGEILATPGQGYKAKADAKNGIELVKKAATDDKIKFELYEDDKKEHRWRLKAANGQIVAVSSEGYKAKADAEKAVQHIKEGAPKAEVVETDK
jgi:uncharacterized protein YegP (UPF0339 family)